MTTKYSIVLSNIVAKFLTIFVLIAFLYPTLAIGASVDYYLKIDGVEGESSTKSSAQPTRTGTEATMQTYSSSTSDDTGTSRDIEDNEDEEKKGNVEVQWKVEEGESLESTGVEPDEIDVAADGEPITPDFGILLGGDDDGELTEESQILVSDILLDGMQQADMPTESVSLNYGKIKTTHKQTVKLFGFIPATAVATVEIDAEENVEVKFPLWAALASGKDKEGLAKKVVNVLADILQMKHETVKNAISNVR